jgi:acyl-coenzyme A thioesterase PaaI-like protein
MSASIAKQKTNTPFPEAVRVQPVSGSDFLFTANVPKDWCGTPYVSFQMTLPTQSSQFSRSAHGGYLQALIFSTARTYFQTHHPARNQPDPITAHTQFLKQVWPGPVKLSVKAINFGSRVSVIQIELSQSTSHSKSQNSKSKSHSADIFIGVIATVTQCNLATEKGLSLPTVPTLRKEDLPDREKDCEEYVVSPLIKKLAPGSYKLDGKVVKGGVEGTFSDYHGRSFREIWYTFADGSPWDVLSLGYLTDMVIILLLIFH